MGDSINFPYRIRCDCWAITISGHGEKVDRRLIYPNQCGAINQTKFITKYSELQLLREEMTSDALPFKLLDSRGKYFRFFFCALYYIVDLGVMSFTRSGVRIESILAFQFDVLKTWFDDVIDFGPTEEKKRKKRQRRKVKKQ